MGSVDQGRRTSRPATVTVGAVALGVKAILGLWASYALLTASSAHHRSFLGATVTTRHTGLGVLLLVLAVASLIVVAGLALLHPMARVAALALEVLGIVLALARITSRPGPAVVSLAVSAVIIGSLLSARAGAAFRKRGVAHQ